MYQVDASLKDSDRQAPSAFTEVSAFAYRVAGTVCEGNRCMATSCGDSGGIELTFVEPADDQTPSDQLGYRIVVLEGTLPASMLGDVGTARPLGPALSFEVPFADVSRLDAVIALVAIDRAGNESAPSAPIRLSDSGCTRTFLSPMCLEDIDRGDGPVDCSVGAAPGTNGARLALALPVAALLLLRRRRRS